MYWHTKQAPVVIWILEWDVGVDKLICKQEYLSTVLPAILDRLADEAKGVKNAVLT